MDEIERKKVAIGKACRHHRKKVLGWTLYRAEKESGMQGQQIEAIEDGASDYTLRNLLRLTMALGISVIVGPTRSGK